MPSISRIARTFGWCVLTGLAAAHADAQRAAFVPSAAGTERAAVAAIQETGLRIPSLVGVVWVRPPHPWHQLHVC